MLSLWLMKLNLKIRNEVEWVKVNYIHRDLLLGRGLQWSILFQHGSIGDDLIEIKLFVSNWKINCHFWKELIMLEIRTRVILIIWKKGSPWCTKPALCHFHRQKRGIGRRVKRPLTGPNLNVRGVCVDSSGLRPLAGPKRTSHHPNNHCTAMKWINELMN